jgi:hypothetical protein
MTETYHDGSRFVPKAECEPPVPDWKRRDWARDVFPAGDPARDADHLGLGPAGKPLVEEAGQQQHRADGEE